MGDLVSANYTMRGACVCACVMAVDNFQSLGGLNDWGWVREGACPLLQPERGFGERCKLPQWPQPLYLFPYLLLTLNAEIDPNL